MGNKQESKDIIKLQAMPPKDSLIYSVSQSSVLQRVSSDLNSEQKQVEIDFMKEVSPRRKTPRRRSTKFNDDAFSNKSDRIQRKVEGYRRSVTNTEKLSVLASPRRRASKNAKLVRKTREEPVNLNFVEKKFQERQRLQFFTQQRNVSPILVRQ